MENKTVITGYGFFSPLGNTFDDFMYQLKGGFTAASDTHHYTLNGNAAKSVGLIETDEAKKDVAGYIVSAVSEALDRAALHPEDLPGRNPLMFLGSLFGMKPFYLKEENLKKSDLSDIEDFSNHGLLHVVNSTLELDCFASIINSFCSSGLHAVGMGCQMIKNGFTDVSIVGGFDLFDPIVFEVMAEKNYLTKTKSRPFDMNADGMYLGEGICILILEELEQAIKRNQPIYAEIAGNGMGYDAIDPIMFSPVGKGVLEAMLQALHDAGEPSTADIDCIVADAKGIRNGDRGEARAIEKIFATEISDLPVTSIKPQLTHTMGASGPLSLLAALGFMSENFITPIKNFNETDPKVKLNVVRDSLLHKEVKTVLVNAIGAGGNASSVLLKKWES